MNAPFVSRHKRLPMAPWPNCIKVIALSMHIKPVRSASQQRVLLSLEIVNEMAGARTIEGRRSKRWHKVTNRMPDWGKCFPVFFVWVWQSRGPAERGRHFPLLIFRNMIRTNGASITRPSQRLSRNLVT